MVCTRQKRYSEHISEQICSNFTCIRDFQNYAATGSPTDTFPQPFESFMEFQYIFLSVTVNWYKFPLKLKVDQLFYGLCNLGHFITYPVCQYAPCPVLTVFSVCINRIETNLLVQFVFLSLSILNGLLYAIVAAKWPFITMK